MDKEDSYRTSKVTCITEKSMVYFLNKEDYLTRFYKYLMKTLV